MFDPHLSYYTWRTSPDTFIPILYGTSAANEQKINAHCKISFLNHSQGYPNPEDTPRENRITMQRLREVVNCLRTEPLAHQIE